jgi:hypothetical protein
MAPCCRPSNRRQDCMNQDRNQNCSFSDPQCSLLSWLMQQSCDHLDLNRPIYG